MTNPEEAFDICAKRRAILEGPGHMLVLGGPGSGKTTIALLKARRSVLERLQPEQSVLFLSFSNAAIRRILESAGKVLTPAVARQIDIKTYHSFAWDILKSHGYLLAKKRRLEIIAAQDAAIIQAGMTDDAWSEEETRLFEQEGRATYDQFAPRAAELLERSSVARRCFSAAHPLILVDEFQDTDEDQWRLVKALSEDSDVIALGDTEQRIYAWRKGVSATRLNDFAAGLKAETYDFQNENNRSPATGIAGYARSLLSPDTELELPDDIVFKRFRLGQFNVGVRVALIKTWNETVKRAGHRDLNIAVAARSRTMVRLISDVLSQRITLGAKEHKPVRHDVMFDQLQITLAARVVAHLLASQNDARNERLAGCLERVGDVFRSSGKVTAIKTSDRLGVWAGKCRDGSPPGTKCVKALIGVLDGLDASGFSGSPTEDWLIARRALEQADADELKRTGGHARYLRLLRRGSAIEEQLAALWREQGTYQGAEAALDEAILQEQLTDSHREASSISVMTMHQLKGHEYDAVLLVEDQHRTFRGRDQEAPYMETRRLLQVSLTRARHFAYILSGTKNATLDVIFGD
ncbi:UvrD-helicase domain-containing protein [Sulfitobacter sp. D35]|uniref:UvrD-helicase domain-containing protein n=1 Tax=Sulfitobacter sp. D35 TaxID=3083252 RepID=UPI00296E370A|nr:UvrD-helicase domain-containing protein [Sulfitobacter sp. D35]MDW4497923.1 UvrD-helicase domain-containing protein [Sulfitobacter sp. D35]